MNVTLARELTMNVTLARELTMSATLARELTMSATMAMELLIGTAFTRELTVPPGYESYGGKKLKSTDCAGSRLGPLGLSPPKPTPHLCNHPLPVPPHPPDFSGPGWQRPANQLIKLY